MDIQENHRITLLNAKCTYVNSLDLISKKMSYGEDISECCACDLYLASQLINRLDCYSFPSDKIGSQFTFSFIEPDVIPSTIFTLNINDINIATALYSNFGSMYIVYNNLLAQAGLLAAPSYNPLTNTYSYIVYSACDTKSITVSSIFSVKILTNTVIGDCTIKPVYNCWKDSDLPKLYEVLNGLLQ